MTYLDKYLAMSFFNEAGASKDVISQSLRQQGADPKTASRLANKVKLKGRVKYILPYFVVGIVASIALYVTLDWIGIIIIIMLIVFPFLGLFFTHDKKKDDLDKENHLSGRWKQKLDELKKKAEDNGR